MAINYTYPIKANPVVTDDFLIIDNEDTVNIKATKRVTVSSVVALASGGSGETYDLSASTNGLNVDLNLISTSAADDSTVQLTAGSNITLTRNSETEITISATGGNAGVSSITNTFGTYISGTNNTATTGAVGLGTINLSAIDGTSIATTRFLSKDNTWDVISASGSNTQFQYNNTGAFAGTPLMVITGNDEIQIGQQTNEQGKLIVSGQAAGTSHRRGLRGRKAQRKDQDHPQDQRHRRLGNCG